MMWTKLAAAALLLTAVAPAAEAFNPQPEPPAMVARQLAGLDTVALNPQPDPPMPPDAYKTMSSYVSALEARGFNPQPEPPGDVARPSALDALEARGFNPQPEPPAHLGDHVGLGVGVGN